VIRRWWERWPGRLEYELRSLEQAGVRYQFDEEARAADIIKLLLQHRLNGEALDLVAIFPDLYPYFRFEVQAPKLSLPRHQHPGAKNLCLLGRATANWRSSDTLAWAIEVQLPRVLKAARDANSPETAALEEPQGEPATDYYQYASNLAILIESGWSFDPRIASGELTLGVKANIRSRAEPRLQGVVATIADDHGVALAGPEPQISKWYPVQIQGRWLRLKSRPPLAAPDQLVEWLANFDSRVKRPVWQPIGGARIDIVGLVFPEEVERRKWADGWLFVARIAIPGSNGRRWRSFYARAVRGGRLDMNGRIPELAPLADSTVAVIGLGALGAPSSLELARAGVGELRLLDFDFVDPGTFVRWPLGLEAAGLLKTTSIPEFLAANYPYAKLKAWTHRIGMVRDVTDVVKSDPEVLDEMLDGATLIYDATAELGVQRLLSDLAREKGIPYICISATEGGWGGMVMRARPGVTEGCWHCLMHHLDTKAIPTPPGDPTGNLQPIGCANPTFTGTGFDLGEVALAGVRLAVATVCAAKEKGYPNYDWDVACLSLRDSDGKLIAPRWDTFPLKRHPHCEACHDRRA
jgi:molybdopterin/thiamine biosynthesis adenylyltransferase